MSCRYSRCGPGLDIAQGNGPEDGLGCLGLGWSCGGSNMSDLIIRSCDNTAPGCLPLAAYSHCFTVWPGWDSLDSVGSVIESFPPPGVQERSLSSILTNKAVSKVHIHWHLVSEDDMARAKNLGRSLIGTPYSWGWLVFWYMHNRHPGFFPYPGDYGIVCSTLVWKLFRAAGIDFDDAGTPNEQYLLQYGQPSHFDSGLPPAPNLVVEEL